MSLDSNGFMQNPNPNYETPFWVSSSEGISFSYQVWVGFASWIVQITNS